MTFLRVAKVNLDSKGHSGPPDGLDDPVEVCELLLEDGRRAVEALVPAVAVISGAKTRGEREE